MKKIGVITNISFEKDVEDNIYINNLLITICDENSDIIEIRPEYNKDNKFFLGNLVEYETDTNKIDYLNFYKSLNKTDLNELSMIHKKYKEENLNNKTLILK